MSTQQWLLGLHVLAAFLFLSGTIMVGLFQLATLRRSRPSEVARLFAAGRVGVALVSLGALAVLVLGVWLAEEGGYGVGDEWVVASLVLWAVALALGGVGGRAYRRARELAERLAAEGDAPSEELDRLVRARAALALNWASLAAVLAILVLMIWKPGAG